MEKAGRARLLIRAAYVEAAVAAGTETQKTYVMANIKIQPEIEYNHNQWCRENGYPIRPYDPGPGRPKKKITSAQAQMRKRPSLRPRVQASSLKPQAPRS